MILVDMVGVVALIALNLCYHHLRVDNGILAKALVDTRPAWVAAQVDDGVVHPWAVGCTALVGSNLGADASQFGIKRCSQIDGLGEQRSALNVGHTVVVVQTVDIGNANIFH